MPIVLLAERPETIPTLASCFVAEWPDYYRQVRAAKADLRECLSTERLPIGLVACDGHVPVGFIALRERAITEMPGHGPGLGALYVAPSHRARGLGSRLVLRGMDLARALGHRTVYAVTARPGKIFTRAGWEARGPLPHKGQSLALYRWRADEHSRADTD